MSREFLTWLFLEAYFQVFREQLARQGAILDRESFIALPVLPQLTPHSCAELYAMGAEVVGMGMMPQGPTNRPMAAPNGRAGR